MLRPCSEREQGVAMIITAFTPFRFDEVTVTSISHPSFFCRIAVIIVQSIVLSLTLSRCLTSSVWHAILFEEPM